jgi:hypothetical protein
VDEGDEGGRHHRGIRQQDELTEDQGLPEDGGEDGQVHRVAHVPVEPAHDQLLGRGHRRWGTQALDHEARERLHQHDDPGGQEDHPGQPQRQPPGRERAGLPAG